MGGGEGFQALGLQKRWENDPLRNFASFGETELSSLFEEVSYSIPNFEN